MSNSQEELGNKTTPVGKVPAKGFAGIINNFVQKNSKVIIIVAIAVIVAVGLIFLIMSNNAKNEVNASKALARIEQYYTKGEYENALNGNDTLPTVRGEKVIGLLQIVSEYGSTSAGERAALYAADAYFNLEKYDDAKIYYEKAVKSNIDVVRVGGLAGVAACEELSSRYKEAAESYAKAAKLIPEEEQRLRYMYFAGLCNEKAGNKDKALESYKDILNLNKYGEFNNLAKAGIVRLGGEIE